MLRIFFTILKIFQIRYVLVHRCITAQCQWGDVGFSEISDKIDDHKVLFVFRLAQTTAKLL